MKTNNLFVSSWQCITAIKSVTIFKILILISLISSLRILLIPLQGDEITYLKIAKNMILNGSYSVSNNHPSTISPIMPFIIGLLFTKSNPMVGIIFARLLNLGILLIGFKYLYRFLQKLKLNTTIILAIITLTFVNNNLILFSLLLYPESVIFCFFWMNIYFLTKKNLEKRDLILIFSSLLILILARYLFAVLGIFFMVAAYKVFKPMIQGRRWNEIIQIIIVLTIIALPFLFWMKFVYLMEAETSKGLSYFARFRTNSLFELLKAGLGFGKLSDVDNYNGLPAFISLFIPKIGLRNGIISIILLLIICLGLLSKIKNWVYQNVFSIMLLIMASLIFAGTGFSRYWLPLLPIFILGFYHYMIKIRLSNSHYLIASKIVAMVYVVNEIRLDILVLKNL